MRLIQNTTLQGFTIPFTTPNGLFDLYLRPRESVMVPDSYFSRILDNLIKRQMLKVKNIVDAPKSAVKTQPKK